MKKQETKAGKKKKINASKDCRPKTTVKHVSLFIAFEQEKKSQLRLKKKQHRKKLMRSKTVFSLANSKTHILIPEVFV